LRQKLNKAFVFKEQQKQSEKQSKKQQKEYVEQQGRIERQEKEIAVLKELIEQLIKTKQ
jgi:TolB-like protein